VADVVPNPGKNRSGVSVVCCKRKKSGINRGRGLFNQYDNIT